MSPVTLAESYLTKCELRLGMLQYALDHSGWSDVVREAQECVELALKGILRAKGRDAPRVHDVGREILAIAADLPAGVDAQRLATDSAKLRREREWSFYGGDDVVPTEAYGQGDAELAMAAAQLAVAALRAVLAESTGYRPAK